MFKFIKESFAISDSKKYKLLTISRKGLASIREIKEGRDIKAKKLFKAKTGDVVFTKQSILDGGVAIITEDIGEVFVSGDMPIIRTNNPEYVWFTLFSKKFRNSIKSKSIGVQGRVHQRIVEEYLLNRSFQDGQIIKYRNIWNVFYCANKILKKLESKELLNELLGLNNLKLKSHKLLSSINNFNISVGQSTTKKLKLKDEGDLPFIRVGNITTSGAVTLNRRNKYISYEEFRSVSETRKTIENGILFAISGAVKKAGVVSKKDSNIVFTNGLAQVSFDLKDLNPHFLTLLFNCGYFYNDIEKLTTGVIPYFGKPELESLSIPNLSIEEQAKIVKKYEEIKNTIKKVSEVIDAISKLDVVTSTRKTGII